MVKITKSSPISQRDGVKKENININYLLSYIYRHKPDGYGVETRGYSYLAPFGAIKSWL
jgi:RNA:NAD 2'-phosphotransferase (TPT1/KptA family)